MSTNLFLDALITSKAADAEKDPVKKKKLTAEAKAKQDTALKADAGNQGGKLASSQKQSIPTAKEIKDMQKVDPVKAAEMTQVLNASTSPNGARVDTSLIHPTNTLSQNTRNATGLGGSQYDADTRSEMDRMIATGANPGDINRYLSSRMDSDPRNAAGPEPSTVQYGDGTMPPEVAAESARIQAGAQSALANPNSAYNMGQDNLIGANPAADQGAYSLSAQGRVALDTPAVPVVNSIESLQSQAPGGGIVNQDVIPGAVSTGAGPNSAGYGLTSTSGADSDTVKPNYLYDQDDPDEGAAKNYAGGGTNLGMAEHGGRGLSKSRADLAREAGMQPTQEMLDEESDSQYADARTLFEIANGDRAASPELTAFAQGIDWKAGQINSSIKLPNENALAWKGEMPFTNDAETRDWIVPGDPDPTRINAPIGGGNTGADTGIDWHTGPGTGPVTDNGNDANTDEVIDWISRRRQLRDMGLSLSDYQTWQDSSGNDVSVSWENGNPVISNSDGSQWSAPNNGGGENDPRDRYVDDSGQVFDPNYATDTAHTPDPTTMGYQFNRHLDRVYEDAVPAGTDPLKRGESLLNPDGTINWAVANEQMTAEYRNAQDANEARYQDILTGLGEVGASFGEGGLHHQALMNWEAAELNYKKIMDDAMKVKKDAFDYQKDEIAKAGTGWQDREDKLMGYIDSESDQQMADLRKSYEAQQASSLQGLIGSGMGNTTVASSIARGLQGSEQEDVRRLSDSILGRRLDTYAKASGERLDAQGNLAAMYGGAAADYASARHGYASELLGVQQAGSEKLKGYQDNMNRVAYDILNTMKERTDEGPSLNEVMNLAIQTGTRPGAEGGGGGFPIGGVGGAPTGAWKHELTYGGNAYTNMWTPFDLDAQFGSKPPEYGGTFGGQAWYSEPGTTNPRTGYRSMPFSNPRSLVSNYGRNIQNNMGSYG